MKIEILEKDFNDSYILKIKHIKINKRDEYGKDHCDIYVDSEFLTGIDFRLNILSVEMREKAIEVGVLAISICQITDGHHFDLEGFGSLCLCGFFEFFDPKLQQIAIEAIQYVSNKIMREKEAK